MNTGPTFATAGPYFLTDLSDGVIPALSPFLGGDAPEHIRATDPIGAAIEGYQNWRAGGLSAPSSPSTPATTGSPWYTRAGVIVLAVIVIAIGVWVVVKQA